jgi:hypothetical protein
MWIILLEPIDDMLNAPERSSTLSPASLRASKNLHGQQHGAAIPGSRHSQCSVQVVEDSSGYHPTEVRTVVCGEPISGKEPSGHKPARWPSDALLHHSRYRMVVGPPPVSAHPHKMATTRWLPERPRASASTTAITSTKMAAARAAQKRAVLILTLLNCLEPGRRFPDACSIAGDREG